MLEAFRLGSATPPSKDSGAVGGQCSANFSSTIESAVDHKSSLVGPLHFVPTGENLPLVIALLFPWCSALRIRDWGAWDPVIGHWTSSMAWPS